MKEEIVIDEKFCPFCKSKKICYVCCKDKYSQSQCENCKSAWKCYVVKVERVKVEYIE